jgi:hypothetical protein
VLGDLLLPCFRAWSAGDTGKPGLVSLVPGGTITYENRNLFGNAASVSASMTTKNFLSPAEDLSFRVQYSQVRALCNTRQLLAVQCVVVL